MKVSDRTILIIAFIITAIMIICVLQDKKGCQVMTEVAIIEGVPYYQYKDTCK